MVTIKGNTYTIRTSAFDVRYLEKNGKVAMAIPDELYEDFIEILSSAGAVDNFITGKTKLFEDETDLITNKTMIK